MTDPSDPTITALTDLLEQSGYPRQQAEALATEAVVQQYAADPGANWGHVHPFHLAEVWQQAARHGKRKLVLEITAEGQDDEESDGRITIEVKGAQTWEQFKQEQAEARAQEVN